MGFVLVLAVITMVLMFLGLRIVQQYEKGVIFRFGKIISIREYNKMAPSAKKHLMLFRKGIELHGNNDLSEGCFESMSRLGYILVSLNDLPGIVFPHIEFITFCNLFCSYVAIYFFVLSCFLLHYFFCFNLWFNSLLML